MSDFATKLLPMVKKTLRQADNEFDDEIGSYIDTVATDLQDSGIHYSFFSSTMPGWAIDGQILQACRWYALSVFGLYNPDMEKYAKAYLSLKATLATQKRYTIKGQYPTGYEHGYADALAKLTDLKVVENGKYFPPEGGLGFRFVEAEVPSGVDSLIDDTITKLSSGVTRIRKYAFYQSNALVSADFPNATSIGEYAFNGCNALKNVNFPKVTSVGNSALVACSALKSVSLPEMTSIVSSMFNSCFRLESVDFRKATSIGTYAFNYCYSLKAVILRSETVCKLSSTNAFSTGCYHFLGTKDSQFNPNGDKDGYFYVRRALIDSYREMTNWTVYASQFRVLEDYTVDGTATGALDESKI